MKPELKNKIRKVLLASLWSAIGISTIILLVAAVKSRDKHLCKGIDIQITGVSNNFFIDRSDIEKIVSGKERNKIKGRSISEFDLVSLEHALGKEVWVKTAQLFFDNNDVLNVNVEEREPVARIFTPGGGSFYIDSSVKRLPLSDKFSANVPVFTGFPSDVMLFSKKDSALLKDIRNLSLKISADTFLMAMIDQVDITPKRYFEMMPKIGNQVIRFGDASDAEAKFEKLKLFYKKIMTQVGWNRYSVINLQYNNQVVAKIRGKDDVSEDSLRTVQMMEIIAANAARMAEDSARMSKMQENNETNTTDVSMIQQNIQRDDESANESTTAENTNATPRVIAPPKLQEKKPEVVPQKKAATPKPAVKPKSKPVEKPKPQQPKITMPKQNDY